MSTRVTIQSTCQRRKVWITTISVQHIKSDQVPVLLFLEWNLKNPTYKSLLLVNYARMNTG